MRRIGSTYLYIAFSGLARRPTRTVLTVLCVAAAFAVFGVLKGVEDTFDAEVTDLKSSASQLFVVSRVSRTDPLPISHLRALTQIPGVATVVPSAPLLGFYQEPKNWVGGFAVDLDREFAVYSDYRIDPAAMERVHSTRNGAIVGRVLADRFHWKIGDRVPIQSQIWPRSDGSYDWPFEIVGIYDGTDAKSSSAFLVRYDYFDEERAAGKGTVSSFVMRVRDARDAPRVARASDALFANSANETLTQSGRDLEYNRFRQLGDVKLMVRLILIATLLLVMLVTANTIRQSVQERSWEFGVLQVVGFGSRQVVVLVLLEAFGIAALGAVCGMAIASLLITTIPAQFGQFTLHSITSMKGAMVAAAIALLSALAPAWRTNALSIAEVLHRS